MRDEGNERKNKKGGSTETHLQYFFAKLNEVVARTSSTGAKDAFEETI